MRLPPMPSIEGMLSSMGPAVTGPGFALELGAKPGPVTAGPMELNIPSIEGIGGSLIYLVDRYGERTIYDVDFVPVASAADGVADVGLVRIDHLTHNIK